MTRSVVLPARPNDRCRSTARVFVSFFSFLAKADRAEEQVGNGAWMLGEACGVDRSLMYGPWSGWAHAYRSFLLP